MANFNVRIIEDDESIHIYTDVSKIGIVDNTISVDYEYGDERAIHQLDRTEEINIKAGK